MKVSLGILLVVMGIFIGCGISFRMTTGSQLKIGDEEEPDTVLIKEGYMIEVDTIR